MLDEFTFHNVSINSDNKQAIAGVNYNNLHSTMFLLIQVGTMKKIIDQSYLHSTMFLLILCLFFCDNKTIRIYIPQCFY